MLVLNWRLALVCYTIIPVMLATTAFFAARARAAFRKARQTVGAVTANLQEEIVGVRQAQALNRTDANIVKFRERNAANRDANVSAVGITSAFSPAIDILSTLSIALVIGYGGWLVFGGRLTIGMLAAFLIYTQQFFRPVQLAASVYTLIQSALAGGERIYAILDEEREPADAPDATRAGERAGAHRVRARVVRLQRRPRRAATTSASKWRRGRRWRSSARPAPARPRSPGSSRASTTSPTGACSSTATTCAR